MKTTIEVTPERLDSLLRLTEKYIQDARREMSENAGKDAACSLRLGSYLLTEAAILLSALTA